jgi:hypothetical protein
MIYKAFNCLKCIQNIRLSTNVRQNSEYWISQVGYPSGRSRSDSRGGMDGRTDMMKVVGVFRLVSVTFPRIAASWILFSIAHPLCTTRHYMSKVERLKWSSKQFLSPEVFVLYFLDISISFTFASPRHKPMTRILRRYKTCRECNNSFRTQFWQYFWTQRRADTLNL